eukprot:TRINITY_DN9166_c0_g1_i1.p1 TRINITY_DN9166_c0_g1~~TRINITY_DN9166_c0_g1_i1.p1  ORF type:complete len:326 (-),score=55.48 TRINITY_DN9166_c0_g1_i1:33-1010(-)
MCIRDRCMRNSLRCVRVATTLKPTITFNLSRYYVQRSEGSSFTEKDEGETTNAIQDDAFDNFNFADHPMFPNAYYFNTDCNEIETTTVEIPDEEEIKVDHTELEDTIVNPFEEPSILDVGTLQNMRDAEVKPVASMNQGTFSRVDEPDATLTTYSEMLSRFMEFLIHKEKLGYKWFINPIKPDTPHYSWISDAWPNNRTKIPIASFAPNKLKRFVTIDWKNWKMDIEQIDNNEGVLTASRTIEIPSDWVAAFKSVKWPKFEEDNAPFPDLDAYELLKVRQAEELLLKYKKGMLERQTQAGPPRRDNRRRERVFDELRERLLPKKN